MIYLIVLNILRTLFDKIIVFYSFLKFVIKFAFYSILLKIREKFGKEIVLGLWRVLCIQQAIIFYFLNINAPHKRHSYESL